MGRYVELLDFGVGDLALLCVEVSEVCGVPKPGIIKIQLCVESVRVCVCVCVFVSCLYKWL